MHNYKLKLSFMDLLLLSKEQIEELNRKLDLILAANNTDDGDKIFTTEEVAKMLDVSKRTLQNYRDTGKISFSQVGRKIYYQRRDVELFIKKNKIGSND